MDGASVTTCCRSTSDPPVTARSVGAASLVASSHPTSATQRECHGRAKYPHGVTPLISSCRTSRRFIELLNINAIDSAYILAPLSGKAKNAKGSKVSMLTESDSRSDPFAPS